MKHNIKFTSDAVIKVNGETVNVKEGDILPIMVVGMIWSFGEVTDEPCTMYTEHDKHYIHEIVDETKETEGEGTDVAEEKPKKGKKK